MSASAQGLTYFVELDGPRALALFARPAVLDNLQRTEARIALAMLDLGPERVEVVRELERRGIATTAWLLLEPEAGYWFTADNAARAAARYRQVRDWAKDHALHLAGVGLDIETAHDDSIALVTHTRRALYELFARRRTRERLRHAHAAYAELVAEIRADGLFVESYQFPLVADERRAGSTLLQRALGIVDLRTDREVLMLYHSLLPHPLGQLLVDAYGADAQGIAVGITGGGVDFLARLVDARQLDLARLITDLRRAARYTHARYVFSLEGCVEAGYFEALCQADLSPAAAVSLRPLALAARSLLQLALRSDPLWYWLRRGLGRSRPRDR